MTEPAKPAPITETTPSAKVAADIPQINPSLNDTHFKELINGLQQQMILRTDLLAIDQHNIYNQLKILLAAVKTNQVVEYQKLGEQITTGEHYVQLLMSAFQWTCNLFIKKGCTEIIFTSLLALIKEFVGQPTVQQVDANTLMDKLRQLADKIGKPELIAGEHLQVISKIETPISSPTQPPELSSQPVPSVLTRLEEETARSVSQVQPSVQGVSLVEEKQKPTPPFSDQRLGSMGQSRGHQISIQSEMSKAIENASNGGGS